MKRTEGVNDYFDRTAALFTSNYRRSAAFEERSRLWARWIEKNRWRLGGDAVCFDMGCGDGTLSRSLLEEGIRMVGIDQSEGMLTLARRRADGKKQGNRAAYLNISLPLPASLLEQYRGSAGLILCSSVLEYVSEYKVVLAQFHRLLKPGGALLISVPNRVSIYRVCERLMKAALPSRDSYLSQQRHQFRLSEMREMLTGLGYRVFDEEFFALPFQEQSAKLFGAYRGSGIATMFIVGAEKEGGAGESGR